MSETPEAEILSRVLYRDALMLVIDKPPGIAVHRGRGGGASLEDEFHHLKFGLPRLPALAHRLDRDTTGCLALGRHRKALARLGQLFRNNRVEKTYLAICSGLPENSEGVIDAPIGPASPDPRNWRMKTGEGAAAETRWRVLARAGNVSLVRFMPLTGRTHQIRVHAAHGGFPIIGDTAYGGLDHAAAPRLMLHALKLSVPLYPRREALRVAAPLPGDFRAAMHALGLGLPEDSRDAA